MSEEAGAAVRYRLQRAVGTLEEAEDLAQRGRWNGVVNRLYYAAFYAVSALLLSRGFSAPRHSGVLSLFNRHFVRTGVVTHDLGALYGELFERRQEGDYRDFVHFDEMEVRPWLEGVNQFVSRIQELVGA
ncbi:MAG: HEPN domain-containing protein [Dehalococcoidia bacterium]